MNKKTNTTKVESISSQLMSMIESGQFPCGKKLPGERQLANKFKASYVTIRNAVQLLVDNNILERIHGSGTYVTQSAMIPNIGIITGVSKLKFESKPFIKLILDNLKDRALERQSRLSSYLFFGDGVFEEEVQYNQLIEDIHKKRIQALIVEPVVYKPEIIELHRERIPITILSASAYELNTVYIDFASMAEEAVKALRESGARKIVFVNAYKHGDNIDETLMLSDGANAFQKTASDLGIKLPAKHIFYENEITSKLLPQVITGNIDGLFFNDDVMAKHFMDKALFEGKKAGSDFMVATLSNFKSRILFPFDEVIIKLEINPAEIADSLMDICIDSISRFPCPPIRKKISPKAIIPNK